MENQKFKHRAVIKFLTKEGVSLQNILERMVNVYQDQSPSYTTVTRWAAEFKRGRDSIEDDPRCGRPVEVMTNEVCDAVEVNDGRETNQGHGNSSGNGHLDRRCAINPA